jgi:ADP-ribose pyrophosphatase
MKVPGVRSDDSFKVLEMEQQFRGKMVGVSLDSFRFPDGKEIRHETIQLPAAVSVMPVLEETPGRKEVVLVEQYRTALQGYIHEIPAGILEEGEDPAFCAGRELEEETGYTASALTLLTTLFPIPGTSAHQMYFFMAEGLQPGEQRLEDAECLMVKKFPLEDLIKGLASGDEPVIVDAKTHLGLLHVALRSGLI